MNPISYPLPGRLWVVQLADLLAKRVHEHVKNWPWPERKDLGDQLVRSVDSISANVAEGYVRLHVKERQHFFSMAQGSLEESVRHLRKARDRQLISDLETFTVVNLLGKLSMSLQRLAKKQ